MSASTNRSRWWLAAVTLVLPVPTLAFLALAGAMADSGPGEPSYVRALLVLAAASALLGAAGSCLRRAQVTPALVRAGCLLGLCLAWSALTIALVRGLR